MVPARPLPTIATYSPPMRIAVVTTFFPNSADPYRTPFIKNLVKAMKTLVELDVIAPVAMAPAWISGSRWARLHNIPVREVIESIEVLHPKYWVVPKMNWFSGIGYFLGIWRHMFQRKREYGSFLVHAHCGYPDAVGVSLVCFTLRLPFVVTLHGSDINVYSRMPLLRPQIRWALARAHGIIAVSSALAIELIKLLPGIQDRMVCIPCAGFDPAVFYLRKQNDERASLGLSTESRVILFVGHLVSVKAVDVLINAWALRTIQKQNTDDLLVIIGSGECRLRLEEMVRQLEVDASVSFTGSLPQSEVSRWLAVSNALCLPSRSEGMPNVVIEAMATGIPVVASRVGGIPELVTEGVNGLLVEPGCAYQLAVALDKVLNMAWSREAISESVKSYTWGCLAARNVEFFHSLKDGPEQSILQKK